MSCEGARSARLVLLLLATCATTPRRLTYDHMISPAMNSRAMAYAVYSPPGWTPQETLPLVVFLHGGGDGHDCFDEYQVAQALDQAVAAGQVPRVVVVVPEGELGFWSNWYDGSRRYEDWVVENLMPRVREQYHTQRCPAGCHAIGISMGGFGALRLALHRPHLFASVSSLSGPVFDEARMREFGDSWLINIFIDTEAVFGPTSDVDHMQEEDLFRRWSQPSDLAGTRLLLAWGTEDREFLSLGNAELVTHLQARDIEHQSFQFVGGHDWDAWIPALAETLRMQVAPPSRR